MAIITPPNQMEEGNGRTGRSENQEGIYSRVIHAGKRTYFLDVKATRRNDFYLTITESRKRFDRDGHFFFEKHKVFIYREDLERFAKSLSKMVNFIRRNEGEYFKYPRVNQEEDYNQEVIQDSFDPNYEEAEVEVDSYSNIDFEDLEENR